MALTNRSFLIQDYVLIPDYKDALLVDAVDTALDAAQTYTDAGVPLRV